MDPVASHCIIDDFCANRSLMVAVAMHKAMHMCTILHALPVARTQWCLIQMLPAVAPQDLQCKSLRYCHQTTLQHHHRALQHHCSGHQDNGTALQYYLRAHLRALLHVWRLHQLLICLQSNHRSNNTSAQGGRRDRGKYNTLLTANL